MGQVRSEQIKNEITQSEAAIQKHQDKIKLLKDELDKIADPALCGKILYPSEKEARKAIKLVNVQIYKYKGAKASKIKSFYYCDICKAYHLTSKIQYGQK
jgi:hypothetical protein